MFELFKAKPFQDAQLGELRRARRLWKGALELAPCGRFRLSLAGSRDAPDAAALELARELPQRFRELMPEIQEALFDHYEPYKEAADAGERTGSPCPNLAGPADVWPHVTPAHVLIEFPDGAPMVEIAFRTEWDIEHTVAAIVCQWQLYELNGSVRTR
jgi:hypothetical protein